jgi:hypothetical protein
MNEPWIFPEGSVARTVIEETFAACQLRLPQATIVSSSLALHEAMLATDPLLAMWPASVLLWGARRHFVRPLPGDTAGAPASRGDRHTEAADDQPTRAAFHRQCA